MRLADAARDGADTASSQPMLRSIRSLKIPYRKFDLTIGKLSLPLPGLARNGPHAMSDLSPLWMAPALQEKN
jgi:hypothetical protein